MTSSVFIDGSLPDPGDGSTKGLVFAGRWAVEYDWSLDRVTAGGQPKRLSSLPFPAPYDSDLEGALRGRGAYSSYLYLFKNGRYLRLQQATLTPDGPDAETAPAWDLPADWTSFDAVLPGRGTKINFCYFFRGNQYIRFDWTTDRRSPNYPKFIAPEWHMSAPFTEDFDGVIVGQAAYSTKGYLFKTLPALLDDDGAPVTAGAGAHAVSTPGYSRYDFSAEASQGSETSPLDVVPPWSGLFPLLDAGRATDTALQWCDAALGALTGPMTAAMAAALQHHFMTATPTPAQLAFVQNRFTAVRARIATMPDRFQWTPGFGGVAQTVPATLTEIGDDFSITHGPNGRAAVLIHEAVHFTYTGGTDVDVPEWSGATINGVTYGIDAASGMAYGAMTTDQAVTNPSSYAAFAQEMFFGDDRRYGDARRHE